MMNKRMWDNVKCICAIIIFIAMLGVCGYVESHYTRKDCVVVEVEQRLVTVEDRQGRLWCYYMDSEDYTDAPSVGTVVDVHMYTNHTDSYIYDDEIVGVRVVVQ